MPPDGTQNKYLYTSYNANYIYYMIKWKNCQMIG